jgi:peptidoglycan/LPS O-acetylase OafA/YrhL
MRQNASAIGYFPQLDGIRAFAVLGVITEHWAYQLPDYGVPAVFKETIHSADLGGLGVECFFVLSGFLITLLLLDGKVRHGSFRASLGRFYVRRVLRIFPVYYASILVLFLSFDEYRSVLGWHALYLSNLYPFMDGGFVPVGGHFWSLSVEEQFYLLWPLLVLTLSVNSLIVISLVLALLGPVSRVVIWILFDGQHLLIATFPTASLDLLCFGGFLACLKHLGGFRAGGLDRKILLIAGVVSFVCYVFLFFFLKEPIVTAALARTFTAVFVGAVIVEAALGFTGPTKVLLGNRLVVWIGTVSYGLYLFHPFVPKLYSFGLELFGLDKELFVIYWIRFPLLFLVLLLITSLSFYFFETPIRKLKVRFH